MPTRNLLVFSFSETASEAKIFDRTALHLFHRDKILADLVLCMADILHEEIFSH